MKGGRAESQTMFRNEKFRRKTTCADKATILVPYTIPEFAGTVHGNSLPIGATTNYRHRARSGNSIPSGVFQSTGAGRRHISTGMPEQTVRRIQRNAASDLGHWPSSETSNTKGASDNDAGMQIKLLFI